MRIVVAVFAAMFLGACSTTPVTRESAASIPPERVYQPSFLQPAEPSTEATVTFLRDAGFVGSGCSHDMFVDNIKVFSIRAGEQIAIRVPAGLRVFRLETGGGLCPNIAASQETTLMPGGRASYRILLPSDGSLRLTRIE